MSLLKLAAQIAIRLPLLLMALAIYFAVGLGGTVLLSLSAGARVWTASLVGGLLAVGFAFIAAKLLGRAGL